jgi:hypothetical protein
MVKIFIKKLAIVLVLVPLGWSNNPTLVFGVF